jgi:hypothetical protein
MTPKAWQACQELRMPLHLSCACRGIRPSNQAGEWGKHKIVYLRWQLVANRVSWTNFINKPWAARFAPAVSPSPTPPPRYIYRTATVLDGHRPRPAPSGPVRPSSSF